MATFSGTGYPPQLFTILPSAAASGGRVNRFGYIRYRFRNQALTYTYCKKYVCKWASMYINEYKWCNRHLYIRTYPKRKHGVGVGVCTLALPGAVACARQATLYVYALTKPSKLACSGFSISTNLSLYIGSRSCIYYFHVATYILTISILLIIMFIWMTVDGRLTEVNEPAGYGGRVMHMYWRRPRARGS